jgi:diguanylate cyclase (GGDEF)-like protein
MRTDERYAIRAAGARTAQLRIQHDALHDRLTGLPNRTLFSDRVGRRLLRPAGDPSPGCAVLCFDVERFTLVNDSLGHAVGDRLLVAIAERVAAALAPGDTLARMDGDDFAVLVEDVADEAEASAVAGRVRAVLDRGFDLDGHEVFATVSIGIALSEPILATAGLIANADIALYAAKRGGRARTVVFDTGMRRRVLGRLTRENEVRQVVDGAQLEVHYQPIVSLRSGAICGLEALARWPGDREPVAPAEFISIAEDTGMIAALGRQVLEAALQTLAGWRRDGLIGDDVCMSVNLSGRQLDDPALAEQIRAAIRSASLPASALKLEITESTLIAESERTQRVFADVCAGGVGLHLDDFGTGYSSLAALHRLPVDALKIDRSFIAGLPDAGRAIDVIVRTTVGMAHSLGLPVIAEGIENPEQLDRLRSFGCDYGQGHLFSPALSATQMRGLLEGWRCDDLMAAAMAA